jgi:hypothetical protein
VVKTVWLHEVPDQPYKSSGSYLCGRSKKGAMVPNGAAGKL